MRVAVLDPAGSSRTARIYLVCANGVVKTLAAEVKTSIEEYAFFKKSLDIMKGQYDCGIIIDNLGFEADHIIAAVPLA